MKKLLIPACLVVTGLIAPGLATAQDVAITNARIIVGSGQVIESGTIIVRGGKIVSVTAGAAPTQGLRIIDAKGMSAMPGFIDGHKHVNNFGRRADAVAARSRLHHGPRRRRAGGQNIALRDRIDKGEFVGPRIIASGQVNLRQTPAEARAAVQALAAKGVKHTGEIGLTPEPAPPQAEIEVLKAIVDEAKKVGRAGQRARREQPGDGRGDRCWRDAPGAPAEQGLHELRPGGASGADRLDRRRHDRLRRAEHRHAVGSARAGAVAEGQHRALPRRQTVARSDRRRQPRPERAARPAPRAATRSSTSAASGTPTRTIRRSRIPPTRTPRTSWCWSTS